MDGHSSSHYAQGMQPVEAQYAQQQAAQQQHWAPAPHLLPPSHGASPYHSPAVPHSQLADQQSFPSYFHAPPGQPGNGGHGLERSSSLSLNLSALTVTSPTNLSPIIPSPHPSSSASTLSPVTPISPITMSTTPQQHVFVPPQAQAHRNVPSFAYAPADHGMRYDQGQYDISLTRPPTRSRSSSSSDKSVPRKRSFSGAVTPMAVNLEESIYEASGTSLDLSTPASFDEVEMGYVGLDSQNSPIEGSSSSGEHEDQFIKPLDAHMAGSVGGLHGIGQGSASIHGKTTGTNNFVTKLYQMINDPKSSSFINWTELGTSFVVSNVGEFSRSILGSHFKHNNFSSFVRQLNMYGFHKINRTPRAQRTSTDAQTWEFSHHKFLRGRPDLLDEIKRKALEPDPAIKHRVELPGEVAAQLNMMREQNRHFGQALDEERAKVERLTNVTKSLFDFVSKAFPGALPNFPLDLLEPNENPPIFVTSPAQGGPSIHYPHSSMSLNSASLHSLHSLSPGSSPTTADFPSHVHNSHSLSRTHSLQHIPYDSYGHGMARYDTALQTPLPPSPGPMDHFGPDSAGSDHGRKRQRTGPASLGGQGSGTGSPGDDGSSKRYSRARSDSAPLGYAIGQAWPHGNRPRSGSTLNPRGGSRRDDVLMNISSGLGGGSVGHGYILNGSRDTEYPPIQ